MNNDPLYGFDHLGEKDKPQNPETTPLEVAKDLSKRYPLDKKIYIVRGDQLFVVHSKDVVVKLLDNGQRNITIKNAQMVKYDPASG